MNPDTPLLSVRGLSRHFPTGRGRGVVRAVDGVDLDLLPRQTLALVGESGCGKSTLARTLLRLEEPDDGRISFQGQDITSLTGAPLRQWRRHAQLVFQDADASLNPRLTAYQSVADALAYHDRLGREALRQRVDGLLGDVGLSAELGARYPHQLSGGQKQRVGLARALALQPRLLVLDEVTSALDLSVQARILNLLAALQARHALTYLFISHDLSVVYHLADRVAVMYLGRIVEQGPCEAVFESPLHPYGRALLATVTDGCAGEQAGQGGRPVLAGEVPDPADPPPGCPFHPRCPQVEARCRQGGAPPLVAAGAGRTAACWLVGLDS